MNLIIFLVVVFGNVWIWKIFNFNLVAGLVSVIASFLLYFYSRKKNLFVLTAFLITLFIGLLYGNRIHSPNLSLNKQETLLSQQRLNEYPPITWAPIAHWFEERKETIGFYKLIDNFSEVVSPNLYFFANHPRERVGITEIEKFPYILLPLFIYGVFLLISEKDMFLFISAFFIPVTYYSIFGTSGDIDPYLLFPFIVLAIWKGVSKLGRTWLVILSILFVLVLTQSIIYAKF